MENILPITRIIKAFLSREGIKMSVLAEMLGESASNLSQKLAKNDLDTFYVMRISKALNHNFFEDLARQYRTDVKKEPETMSEMMDVLRAVVKQNNELLMKIGTKEQSPKSATTTEQKPASSRHKK